MERPSWIDEFVKIMVRPHVESAELTRAMDLKAGNLPRVLYRYRSIDKYTLQGLNADTVWINPADKFNDPFDSSFSVAHQDVFGATLKRDLDKTIANMGFAAEFLTPQDRDEIKNSEQPLELLLRKLAPGLTDLTPERREQHIAALGAVVDEMGQRPFKALSAKMRSEISLCCFTTDNSSVLMWSHYASSHKGICVEYSIESMETNDIRRRALYPVIYSPKIFDATPFFLEVAAGRPWSPFLGITAALFKSPEWAYEREWRLVLPISPRNYPMPKPRAIYLGPQITDEDRKTVEAIAKQRKIRVVPMQLANGEFKVEPAK